MTEAPKTAAEALALVAPFVEEGRAAGMADYHNWKLDKNDLLAGPISCSMLKSFDVNPYAWILSDDIKQTEAMRIGSLFDAALTDPDALDNLDLFLPRPQLEPCEVAPFDSFRTKESQAWKRAKEDEGIRVVSKSVRDTEIRNFQDAAKEWEDEVGSQQSRAKQAAQKVMDHPIAGEIMRGAELQVGIIGDVGGIPAKCLLDILPSQDGDWSETIFDYKTTGNGIDDESIRKTMGNFKLHWQAAFYRTMFNKFHPDRVCDQFGFIFQDVKTLEVRVITLHEDDLMLGTRAVKNALKNYAKCAHNGIKSWYLDKATNLNLMPYHAMSEDERLTMIEHNQEGGQS